MIRKEKCVTVRVKEIGQFFEEQRERPEGTERKRATQGERRRRVVFWWRKKKAVGLFGASAGQQARGQPSTN